MTDTRPKKPSLLRRVAKGMVIVMALFVASMIALWNWPAGFQWVSVRLACFATGMDVREVTIDGHVVPYLERPAIAARAAGAELPTVLCLHGFGTSKESSFLISQMFPGHRFVAPDLPPFGQSDPESVSSYSPEQLVAYIDRFATGVSAKPALVVGTSMGGALATAYAHAHPDAVCALVLLAPAGVKAPVENEFVRSVREGGHPLRIASTEDFDRMIKLVFVHPPATPGPIRAYLVDEAITTMEARDRAADSLGAWLLEDGVTACLPSVQQPTLVLFGDGDLVIDPSCLPVFLDRMPHATGALIPGAGHVIFADAPLATRDAITVFLQSLPAGR
ncbi:MAG: alpha/beta hydrolase [Planctomycetota bacterium]|nr:alpha/beta hydrolase [Planctomycetota bacterium]MDA1105081.1 alpha/beta hydrolase [Planctomycetota bacterium]